MPRSPLVLETHGSITRRRINGTPTAFTRYRDADGITRKVQRSGRTLADAEARLKEALKKRHLETEPDATLTTESTIDQLVQEWLTEARESGRYAVATLRTYDRRAKSTITPAIGGLRLLEITVSRLDRFVKLTTKHHGAGTSRTVRSVLVNAFDLAVRHGLVDFNYARNTAPVPTTRSTPDAPTVETVRELVSAMMSHDQELAAKGRTHYLHDLTMLYAATGARTAELLALTWDQVTFDDAGASVAITSTLVVDEDGKLYRQKYTKSAAGMRRLRVPKAAAVMLQARRVDAYNEIVFPSSTGTFRWPHNLRRDWREVVAGTKFDGLTPKAFRKAVATLLRDQMGIGAAKDQLGHSDTKVTERHYAQRVAEAPDATSALGLFFESAG